MIYVVEICVVNVVQTYTLTRIHTPAQLSEIQIQTFLPKSHIGVFFIVEFGYYVIECAVVT